MSKDGGPAFPEVFSTYSNEDRTLTDVYSAGGMSLRDYFAAAALPAAMSMAQSVVNISGADPWANAARIAYGHADAMLKAREQRDGDERDA